MENTNKTGSLNIGTQGSGRGVRATSSVEPCDIILTGGGSLGYIAKDKTR